jgi:hypothetical protein
MSCSDGMYLMVKFGVRSLIAVGLLAATVVVGGVGPASATGLDGTCVASITLNFSPPATDAPSPGPASTSTGSGTISTCVFTGGGATSGTFTYTLTGNLTCLSASNIAGTLDISWADATQSHATVTGLVTSLGSAGGAAGLSATIATGRFAGDTITIANIRDPLALLECLISGLAQATGITSLTFTQP